MRWSLTPGQQTLAEGGAEHPARGVNLQQLVMEVSDPLQPGLLQAAWAEMMRRHPTLRAQLVHDAEGSLWQQFASAPAASWLSADWTERAAEAVAARWQRWLSEDRAAGFDLKAAPWLRWHLFQLPQNRRRLVFTFHHLLLDGRSLPPLLREWRAIYDALENGQDPPAVAAPPMAAYLEWHATWLAKNEAAGISFWRDQLRGFRGCKPLPSEYGESGAAAESVDPIAREWLTAEETSALTHLATNAAVSLFTLVHAAWALVLGAQAQTDDMVMGSVRAARHLPWAGAAEMLGMFANTLPIRARLGGGCTVRDLLADLRQQELRLREFEHSPPAWVRRAGEVPSGQPLYWTATVFERFDLAEELRRSPGCHNWRFELRERPVLPLTLAAQARECLAIQVVGDGVRYGPATAARLARQTLQVLRALPGKLESRLDEIDLVAPEERHELIHRRNQTDAPLPATRLLHQWFEQQAAAEGAAIAVVEQSQTITYQALNDRADHFARRLRARGIGRQTVVAVYLERSIAALVSLLGVLKAGGVYLPLATNLPPERLRSMLREAQARLLIHDSATEGFVSGLDVACLNLDRSEAPRESEDQGAPPPANPDELAYAIFTSGSTGTPKLVGIEHRHICNLLDFATRRLFQPADVACVPFVDLLSFDSSIHQIFVPLALGGKLVVLRDIADLPCTANAHAFSYFGTTPSSLQVLLEEGLLPASIRCLGLGGEAIPAALVNQLHALPHVQRVFNFYGPTETTIYCTCSCLLNRSSGELGSVPDATGVAGRVIGRPIHNMRVYVVAPDGQLVPDGVPGELWVAGAGVARGYLNAPDGPEVRFSWDPFGAGEWRLYRTGDLVRFRADGQLEFLGRLDDQLKINGTRIEPGEIEHALEQHPAIVRAAVISRETPERGKSLVAFLLPREREGLSVRSLQHHLQSRLPSHLIPADYVAVEQLPLTPSGKVDRRALPQCIGQSVRAQFDFVGPRDHTELVLAGLWRALLQLETINIKDDFFALGGNSLMAARLASQAQRWLGQSIPFHILFTASTIEQLAAWLKSHGAPLGPQSLVPLQPAGRKPPFYFVHGWGGGVLGFAELARQLGPDQPVYGLMAVGLDGTCPRHGSVPEMAAQYAAEIRGHQPEGPYYLGGFSAGGWIAFAVAEALERQGQRVAMLALIDPHLSNCRLPLRVHLYWLAGYTATRLCHHARRFLTLPRAQQWSYGVGRWRAFTTISRRSSPAALARTPPQPAAGTDYYCELVRRYQPSRLVGTIDFFHSEETPIDRLQMWRRLTSGPVSLHPVRGRHLDLLQASVLPGLAKAFRSALIRAQGAPTGGTRSAD